MARRIEIELTSARPDGSWTWRAAGALKPRGVLDGKLLAEGAKAGDVLRVDAEFEIEGITIVAVLPSKEKRAEPERLEIIGPPRAPVPGVTTSLTRPPRDGDDAPRRPRREGGPGRDGVGPAGRGDGENPDRPPRPARTEGSDRGTGGARPPRQDRPRIDRGSRPGGPLTTGGPGGGERRPGGGPGGPGNGGSGPGGGGARSGPRGPRSESGGPPGPGGSRAGGGEGPGGPGGASPRGQRPPRPPRDQPAWSGSGSPASASTERPKARRLNPGNTNRNALLESLPPEHRPIAEQVIRGGIPAVRTAIHLEGEKATAEGRPAPNADALLAIAEDLLPKVKGAEWRDRADAAAKMADELPLRELRAILDGASAARDEVSRSLAATLRETLDRRLEAQRSGWVEEIQTNLAETRVVRALRLSARPPDATTKLPADLAAQLTEAAGKAMSADTPSERWAAMLEAVAASPVRRQVKPEGLPSDANEPLLQAARQQSGRIPALAPMLGITMPPPPGPIRPSAPHPS
jgi:hypothetical protein